MTAELIFVVAFAFITTGVLSYFLWNSKTTLGKMAAVIAPLILFPMIMVFASETLGKAKNTKLEWIKRDAPRAVVLSHFISKPKIYLWILLPGESAPRYYSIPFTKQVKKQLESARHQQNQHGGQIVMERPFKSRSQQGHMKPVFRSIPPLPRPLKQY